MTDITNTLSNGTGTITGATQHISDIQVSEAQGDIIIAGLFFITAILIICSFSFLKTYAIKSCTGCKRLIKCEEEIKHIKKDLLMNNLIDSEILKTIAQDITEIKKRIVK